MIQTWKKRNGERGIKRKETRKKKQNIGFRDEEEVKDETRQHDVKKKKKKN